MHAVGVAAAVAGKAAVAARIAGQPAQVPAPAGHRHRVVGAQLEAGHLLVEAPPGAVVQLLALREAAAPSAAGVRIQAQLAQALGQRIAFGVPERAGQAHPTRVDRRVGGGGQLPARRRLRRRRFRLPLWRLRRLRRLGTGLGTGLRRGLGRRRRLRAHQAPLPIAVGG
ncbi:hypothetical protein AZ17_1377, partial [Bordetella bronchiseptica D989]